jgi:hypothetical protein
MIENYPSVDDGTVYPDILKFIKENDFTVNIDKQMKMTDLQKQIPSYKFKKVADCVLNTKQNFSTSSRKFITEGKNFDGKLVDYIPTPEFKKKWKAEGAEWVYTILYDGNIVKIGMTSSGMSSRYTSYGAGTKKAMTKGSCATTNFVVSQCNYLALLKGMKVEIFAYEIPITRTTQVIFGREEEVLNKVAHAYEFVLIDIYKNCTNGIPFLCGQSG